MTENLPDWLSVPLIVILWATVAYKFWILPGYENDRGESRTRTTKEDGEMSKQICKSCGHIDELHQGTPGRCWYWVYGYQAGVICNCTEWETTE